LGGRQTQVRHSNAVNGARVVLTFDAITNQQLKQFRNHFISVRGRFNTFELPSEAWTGMVDPAQTGYSWRYLEAPSVTDVGCGRHNLSIELELLPEVAPEPVLIVDQVIAYSDGSVLVVDGVYSSVSGTQTHAASGGPFDEPYMQSPGYSDEAYTIELGSSSPGAGDYTLEVWYRRKADVAGPYVFMMWADGQVTPGYAEVASYLGSSNNLMYMYSYTTSPYSYYELSGSATTTDWRMLAACREGNTLRFYDNGSLLTTVTSNDDYEGLEPIELTNAFLYLDAGVDIGQVRYTKDFALYTGTTMTVPTAPFIAV
jgi:hypothetical protein